MKEFSIKHRKEELADVQKTTFDLVVIGGGITGAGIALDAVSRGLTVLLLEKSDFASGTSSKSTKLIHGGLRYLKQFQIGLVRETGTERAIVHRLAPHLVHPEKMLLPIIKNGSFTKFSAGLAIWVYDRLARVREKDRRQVLSRESSMEVEPLLKQEILKSGVLYSEYRTDDARLCLEVIKKARQLGATVFNYTEVTELVYDSGRVSGVKFLDKSQNLNFQAQSKFVVSATGPWVDNIRARDAEVVGKHLRLTKGIHIVVDNDKLPVRQAIYFDDQDKGRMLFAIPRSDKTYIGTTDTDYQGSMDDIQCTKDDIEYLLRSVNRFFDAENLQWDDIVSSWAGLRPLIAEQGKSAGEVSRKDEIFESESGLISIAGGKLTGYRKMAKRIVDQLIDKLHRYNSPCLTDEIQLTRDAFKDYEEVLTFVKKLEKECITSHVGDNYIFDMVGLFGKVTKDFIYRSIPVVDGKRTLNDKLLLPVVIEYCITFESCWTPLDFVVRRTAMLYFHPERLSKNMELIVDCFAKVYNYSEEVRTQQLATLKEALERTQLKHI